MSRFIILVSISLMALHDRLKYYYTLDTLEEYWNVKFKLNILIHLQFRTFYSFWNDNYILMHNDEILN